MANLHMIWIAVLLFCCMAFGLLCCCLNSVCGCPITKTMQVVVTGVVNGTGTCCSQWNATFNVAFQSGTQWSTTFHSTGDATHCVGRVDVIFDCTGTDTTINIQLIGSIGTLGDSRNSFWSGTATGKTCAVSGLAMTFLSQSVPSGPFCDHSGGTVTVTAI